MNYTNVPLIGLGKVERQRLSALLRETQVTVSVKEAASILGMSSANAGKLLATLAKKGWLARIKSGIYIYVPLESLTSDVALEDEFAIAEKLFSPCYIAGWSAASYWGMTEQIFQSVVVMTQNQQKNYRPIIKDTEYLLYFSNPEHFFGLESVWTNNIKIQVSNPSRTIVDLINKPQLGGGMRACCDILKQYFSSDEVSIDLLIKYLKILNVGATYKRMGFLIEKLYPEQKDLISECENNLSCGYSKLDSTLECEKLVTKWRLWVPKQWK